MSHKLYVATGEKTVDLTPIVGNISLSSDMDTLGQQLTFEVAYSDVAQLFPKNPCDLGHLVMLTNGHDELYRGIIVTEDRNGREAIAYTSLDAAFYLNQSTVVYQFNRTVAANATEAIRKVCRDFGVPIGGILPLSPVIKKIYLQETPADIIRDIISQSEKKLGIKIRMEMRAGKLYVEKQSDLEVSGTFTATISEPQRRRTIEEMRNSIQIVLQGENDSYTVKAKAKDTALIERYGLLQHTETIEASDIAKARQVASVRLKELGRVFEDNSVRLLGNDAVRAGRIVALQEPMTGLTGRWLIRGVHHSITSAGHIMDVRLGVLP
ncbi:hypothetical protein ACFFSY_13825 [Paenibacillus aurantiacus]|uniref:YqbQ/XkdQ domain-containing protein n=1 Tax=Paenibacillus aurantiacus TaxID=1936118 RepID=A0ABV5KP53_9BACL